MASKIKSNESELEQIVKNDGSLADNREKRMQYISYAVLFSSDFINNLDLTSIELDEKYATGNPVSWRTFLNHTSVKKFIDGFLLERAEKQSMLKLGEGSDKTTDAIKIKEMVDSKKTGDDNSNLVIVFLPQKEYNA